MLAGCSLLWTPRPAQSRCVTMSGGSMWSELRAYRASEFKAGNAEQKTRKRDIFTAWTETQSSRFAEMLQPVVRSLRPPIRRVPSDADEYVPGPGLSLTVVWDRQGPFVVATDDYCVLKARRRRQSRATEAGLARAQFVERVGGGGGLIRPDGGRPGSRARVAIRVGRSAQHGHSRQVAAPLSHRCSAARAPRTRLGRATAARAHARVTAPEQRGTWCIASRAAHTLIIA